MRCYWGDLHNHNGIGYGKGTLDRSYAIARGSLLDVYAFTPHGYWPDAPDHDPEIKRYHEAGFARVREAWPEVLRAAECQDAPGAFVALPAFEWHSTRYGDYCVYFPTGEASLCPAPDLEALTAFARSRKALLIPHHIAYAPGCRGLNWALLDDSVSPVVEAFSEHGCSVEPHTPWPMLNHSMGGLDVSQTVFAQLNRGRQVGVIGSTDNHHGHPASAGEGLTGLYLERLDRESVFDALRKRHTLATSGARIDALLRLDDALMGDRAAPSAATPFSFSASTCAPIAFLQVIKNGVPVHTVTPSAAAATSDFSLRLEFGWGPMQGDAITDWNIEVSLAGGAFIGLSPGFCGGADAERINRVVADTPDALRISAFTSRRNSRPVASLDCRIRGDTPTLTVNCRARTGDSVREAALSTPCRDLVDRDAWLLHADGFSDPRLKLGAYAPGHLLEFRGSWPDPSMRAGDWYLLKVQQQDGHLAWTSPIRID